MNTLKFNEDGAVMVELALILPVILIVFGILISGAQLLFATQSSSYAVFLSTRSAMIASSSLNSDEQIGNYVLSHSPFGGSLHANVQCSRSASTTTCSAKGDVALVFPIIGVGGGIVPTTNVPVNNSLTLPTQ